MYERHGQFGTRLYTIWANMKQRCSNPKANGYKNYGGRGISVCREWSEFVAFQKWALENGYNADLEIDRINTNGNYEPSNCRFSNGSQQARNKRKKLNATSAYVGVSWITRKQKWVAQIATKRKVRYLGAFTSETEAAQAYAAAAKEIEKA